MGFTEEWFDEFVRPYAVDEPGGTLSLDSAPIPVRVKAANSKRRLAEIEPDQPEGGSRIEWQAGQDADTALAELPQACDWGSKRDAHGKPKYWKGVKLHAEVTREGIPVAVACSSASLHDSQAFIPLMKKATERIGPHVALADAAYDARRSRRRRRADDAVCHALLNGMPGNGHETQRRPRRVASLVIPFGGILCYKHWKMAFFSYGTMPLHASTDAEHEFMNCLKIIAFAPQQAGRRCRAFRDRS